MRKIYALIPACLISFSVDSFANSLFPVNPIKIDTLNLSKDIAELKKISSDLEKEINVDKKTIKSKVFISKQATNKQIIDDKQAKIDSLNRAFDKLKQSNDSSMTAKKQARENYAYTDTLCAVACYRLLSVKPDSIFYREKIKPSVELFHKIVTPSIKEQYKNLEDLLPNYLKYYNEVRDFLSDLSRRVECKAVTSKNFQTIKENEFYKLGIIKYYNKKVTFSYLLDQIDRIEKAFGMGEKAIKGRAFEQIYDNWFPALEPAPAPVVPAATVVPVSDKPGITHQPEVLTDSKTESEEHKEIATESEKILKELKGTDNSQDQNKEKEGGPVTDNNTNKSQEGGQTVNGQRPGSRQGSLKNDNFDVSVDPVTGERTFVPKKKK